MTVVSNTGPLIALGKADQLALLKQLFGQVLIPPAVHRELLAKSGSESARLDEALMDLIQVTQSPPLSPEVKIATLRLDIGEQQVIALAYERKASLVIIDERLGRAAARQLGLTVTGLAGVLVRAKEAELIPAVRPLLEGIRQRGYWLSDEILDIAAKLAGEVT
jgi:predicted nucleic acid-binding protein